MEDIDSFILGLPTLIMISLNDIYQLLNPHNPVNIFVSRNSLDLDSLSSNKFQYFFNIYLKSKEPQGFGSQSNDSRGRTKIIIEQVELEIHTDNSFEKSQDKIHHIQTLIMSKMYLLQKSLNSFLINTPLLSFLLQNPQPEIQPSDFEAVCSFRQEADRSFLVENRLQNLKLGNHAISIRLYSLPSQAVPELVKEYLASTDITSADFNQLLGGSWRTESEGNLGDQSWDLLCEPDEYRIETHYHEHNKSRDSSDGSPRQRPRTMSTDKPIVAQKYIVAKNKSESPEKERPLRKPSILLEKFRKGEEMLPEVRKEDEEFLQDLFENTKELKEASEGCVQKESNKGLVDEVMKAEMNFYKILKARNLK